MTRARLCLSISIFAATACTGPVGAGAGFETGPCIASECFDGLSCLSDLCVADGAKNGPDDGGDGPAGGGDGAGDGGDGAGDGTDDDGPDDDGPADDGPDDDGPDDDGPADDGPADDGPADDGPADDGPADDGPADDGPADDGPGDDDPSGGSTSGDDGAGTTGGETDSGGTGGVTYDGECCSPNTTPGCADAECTSTICAADEYCCDTEWDSLCSDAAEETCDVCTPTTTTTTGGDSQSCCVAQDGAGCSDAECEDYVCSVDPSCCDTQWTQECAATALFQGISGSVCLECSPF